MFAKTDEGRSNFQTIAFQPNPIGSERKRIPSLQSRFPYEVTFLATFPVQAEGNSLLVLYTNNVTNTETSYHNTVQSQHLSAKGSQWLSIAHETLTSSALGITHISLLCLLILSFFQEANSPLLCTSVSCNPLPRTVLPKSV